MTGELVLRRHLDGSTTILGPVPDRIVVLCEVLANLDPLVGALDADGVLTVLGHRWIPVETDLQRDRVEFIRAATGEATP